MQTELQSLQNAINYHQLHKLSISIHEYYIEDKRKKTKKYYLCVGKVSISPVLDYMNMSHFILGLSVGIKNVPLGTQKDSISIVWHIDDVKGRATEQGITLTDEAARIILKDVECQHDAEYGISWSSIDYCIQDYIQDAAELAE